MRQPGMMKVDVGPGETTAQLLDQLNTVPAGTHLLLSLPKDARALRELDDFNNLRQVAATRQLHLVISSPEKTIVGLARLLGFEVDGRPAGIGTGDSTPAPAAAASPARADDAAYGHHPGRGGPGRPCAAAPVVPPCRPLPPLVRPPRPPCRRTIGCSARAWTPCPMSMWKQRAACPPARPRHRPTCISSAGLPRRPRPAPPRAMNLTILTR